MRRLLYFAGVFALATCFFWMPALVTWADTAIQSQTWRTGALPFSRDDHYIGRYSGDNIRSFPSTLADTTGNGTDWTFVPADSVWYLQGTGAIVNVVDIYETGGTDTLIFTNYVLPTVMPADSTVNTATLATGAVTTAKLATGALSGTKVDTTSTDSVHIFRNVIIREIGTNNKNLRIESFDDNDIGIEISGNTATHGTGIKYKLWGESDNAIDIDLTSSAANENSVIEVDVAGGNQVTVLDIAANSHNSTKAIYISQGNVDIEDDVEIDSTLTVETLDLRGQSEAAGDVMYHNGTKWVILTPIGSPGEVLEVNAGGTAPEWDSDDGGVGSLNAVIYGSMSFADSAETITATGGGTWDPITNATNNLFTVGESTDITMQGDSVTVATSGIYVLTYSLSFNAGNNSDYRTGLRINNSVTALTGRTDRGMGGTDAGVVAVSGILDLTAGDDIILVFQEDAGTSDPTFHAGNFSIHALSGAVTVEESDGSPTVLTETLQFNVSDGFTVTDETGSQSEVGLSLDIGDLANVVAGSPFNGYMYLYQETGARWEVKAMSGGATMDETGAVTITKRIVDMGTHVWDKDDTADTISVATITGTDIAFVGGTEIASTRFVRSWEIISGTGIEVRYSSGVTATGDTLHWIVTRE